MDKIQIPDIEAIIANYKKQSDHRNSAVKDLNESFLAKNRLFRWAYNSSLAQINERFRKAQDADLAAYNRRIIIVPECGSLDESLRMFEEWTSEKVEVVNLGRPQVGVTIAPAYPNFQELLTLLTSGVVGIVNAQPRTIRIGNMNYSRTTDAYYGFPVAKKD